MTQEERAAEFARVTAEMAEIAATAKPLRNEIATKQAQLDGLIGQYRTLREEAATLVPAEVAE